MIRRPSSRRLLLAGACAILAPVALPLRRVRAATLVATPQQTEGPYYPLAFPADSDNDLVQVRGQAAQAIGTILHLQGRVLDTDGRPLDGALVEIWQSDSNGIYDHPGQSGREHGQRKDDGQGEQETPKVMGRQRIEMQPVGDEDRVVHQVRVLVQRHGLSLAATPARFYGTQLRATRKPK